MTSSSVPTLRAPEIAPIKLRDARAFVARVHRHNGPPRGWLWGAQLQSGSVTLGVAIAGRPTARELDDGRTLEITRVATDGTRNACSQLYGRCIRAARALGYQRVYTYTLASEPGSSLLAVGFIRDAEIPADRDWTGPSRGRQSIDLFGEHTTPQEAKVRWRIDL